MTRFFIQLYNLFKQRRALFYTLVAGTFALFAFLASKLEYEEDISKLLPSTDNTETKGLAFAELKVKDRIYMQFFSRSGAKDADALLEASSAFVDSLIALDEAAGDVGEVFFEVDDALRQEAMKFLLENVAVLINTDEGVRVFNPHNSGVIVSNPHISRERVFTQMANNRALLATPEGSVYYRIMRYDPLNLRSYIMSDGNAASSSHTADKQQGFSIEQLLGNNLALYGNHLFTKDTTTALVFISPRFVSFDSGAGTRLVRTIERAREQALQAYPDVEALFHGPPVQSVFNSRQIKRDLMMTTGLSLLIACVLLWLFFGKLRVLPLLLTPVVYGALFAMTCMYLIQGRISLMALGIGAIALGVAISYSLHVITHNHYVPDVVQLLRDQTKPVLLGSLTTVGAFMGLLFTQSPLLRDFGLFASLAMVGATLASLAFLPQWFPHVQPRHCERSEAISTQPRHCERSEAISTYQDKLHTPSRLVARLNAYPLDRQRWLLALIVITFAAGCYMSSRVKFDANLRNIGYNEPEVIRAAERYAEKTSCGLATGYYAAVSDDADAAMHINNALADVCDSLRQAGVIESFTRSSSLLIPSDERQRRLAAWRRLWNPARISILRHDIDDAAKAYGFKPEMFEPFFQLIVAPYPTDGNPVLDLLDSDSPLAPLLANVIEKQNNNYLIYTAVNAPKEQLAAVNDRLASQTGVIVADPFYYTTNLVEQLHNDFNAVLLVSMAFVFITLLLAFRNIIQAVIAFLPMFMSWYIVLGVMALCGLQFNLINIVLSAFIFGIGVDYSIFVMQGLRASETPSIVKPETIKSKENQRNQLLPLLTCHKTAIFLSAIVLIISISSLIFATHPALSSVGTVSLIGMAATILTAYTVEPFLFGLFFKHKKR
jgi:predicted RND superfamily exporter protein